MIKKVFYSLILTFVLIIGFFLLQRNPFFLIAAFLGLLFTILGIYLIYLTKKSKIKEKLFLYMTGISAASMLPASILHNVFYALAILSGNILVLKYIFEFLHAALFLIGIPIAPVLFIVGIIGTLIKKQLSS